MEPYFSTNPKLTDHKRHRNRLLAPWNRMKSDERMFFSSWTHARLPEVIWIYELIHHLGERRSLDVLAAITEAAFETAKHFGNTEDFLCPHFGSYWRSLPTENKDFVLQQLKSDSTAYEVSSGMVRAFVSSTFAMFTSKSTLAVAGYFWNRGLELDDCVPTWGVDTGE